MEFRFTKTAGLVIIIIIHSAFCLNAQRPDPEKIIIDGEPMYKLLNPGDIPAIFNPEFLTVPQSGNYYYEDEPLIMVVDGDSAKAYSTWYLDRHEVVNDFINGKAIAVTW